MTNAAPAGAAAPGLTIRVAAELRAELARHRVSGRRLARELGVAHTWATQRLNGVIALSSEDIDRIAGVLHVDAAELWGRLQPRVAYAHYGADVHAQASGSPTTIGGTHVQESLGLSRLRLVSPQVDEPGPDYHAPLPPVGHDLPLGVASLAAYRRRTLTQAVGQ